MKSSILDGFCNCNLGKNLGVYGIHIYSERLGSHACDFRHSERTHLYSGSKAFTSMATGIALGEGRLTLEDKALDFFPEFRPVAAEGSDLITIRDLLQMRAGHAESLFTADEQTYGRQKDWAEAFFKVPLDFKPGTDFQYDNGCTYMLSRIIEKVSGQTLRDYLVPRLFEPLEIFNPQWHTCPNGHTLGAVGLYVTTEEFSRLGILLLNRGRWNERQIVPEKYIDLAISDIVETKGFTDPECRKGYGYQLWRCTQHGAFRADGKFGQYSVVLPEQKAVVTVTAHNEGSAFDILRAIWSEILPLL